jgi:hypothetical protein
VDKYYILLRQFINRILNQMKANEWSAEIIDILCGLLQEEMFLRSPNGIRYHIADVFVPEICLVGGDQLSTGQFLRLLRPVLTMLETIHDRTLWDRLAASIFKRLPTDFKFGAAPPAPKAAAPAAAFVKLCTICGSADHLRRDCLEKSKKKNRKRNRKEMEKEPEPVEEPRFCHVSLEKIQGGWGRGSFLPSLFPLCPLGPQLPALPRHHYVYTITLL